MRFLHFEIFFKELYNLRSLIDTVIFCGTNLTFIQNYFCSRRIKISKINSYKRKKKDASPIKLGRDK